jgi:hypothetical protein
MKKSKMKIYDSLATITVYIFFEILDTEDYTYLIKKREKFIDKENPDIINISEVKKLELQNVFKNIVSEHAQKTHNFKLFNDIKKKIYISRLEYEFDLISAIVKIFENYEEIEVLFVLDSIGFNFENSDSIESELKKAIIHCKALKNKININKIKYNKANKKSDEDKDYNIDAVALSLERALDMNYKLDIRKLSMLRWVNLINLSKKTKNG